MRGLSLFLFTVVFSGNLYSQSLLSAFEEADIVFYGEQHSTEQHHDPIWDSLEEGIKSGKINTFATEYVPHDLNNEFQAFLNSPTATSGSEEEILLFSKLSERVRFPESRRGRDFYQKLREIKLKYKDKIKFCGVDYQPTREQEDSELSRLEAYQQLPQIIQDKIEELSEKSIEDLSKDDIEFYREAHMGNNISNCFDSDERKGIVHVGSFHAYSIKSVYNDNVWWTASKYFNLLRNRSIKTVSNLITYLPSDPEEIEGDVYSEALISISCLGGYELPVVIEHDALPENIKDILTYSFDNEEGEQQMVELFKIYDAFILGPMSTEVERDDR